MSLNCPFSANSECPSLFVLFLVPFSFRVLLPHILSCSIVLYPVVLVLPVLLEVVHFPTTLLILLLVLVRFSFCPSILSCPYFFLVLLLVLVPLLLLSLYFFLSSAHSTKPNGPERGPDTHPDIFDCEMVFNYVAIVSLNSRKQILWMLRWAKNRIRW